ncbi:hypothetical protein [Halobacillus alkaliphilus]|uniref:hypothetical protein n=1 Tax=Halobacillus alkaliphilus TaxID=396056 RepID=UPI0015872831|nr:hypothetical protein [Halobacillus alkaliphilus]
MIALKTLSTSTAKDELSDSAENEVVATTSAFEQKDDDNNNDSTGANKGPVN